MFFLLTDTVTYLSCTMEFAPVAFSRSILLYSLRYLSRPSSAIGMSIVCSKSALFKRRLLIVIFVVAPLSSELSSSEYSRNIASLKVRSAAYAVFLFEKSDITFAVIIFLKLTVDTVFPVLKTASSCQNRVNIFL